MNIRRTVVATGLCLSLLTAGCASAVAGQAQIASGAALPTSSQSAPAPFPDPSGNETQTSEPTSSDPEDTSDAPTPVTSIPGLSKDCSAVLAGITAFSMVLQGGDGTDDTISQATVDTALRQLPESGLPARPQADITVLRKAVSGAAGKTLSEVGLSMVDGKVVNALKDLSSWAQDNCG